MSPKKTAKSPPDVRVGDVWRDLDPRAEVPRTLKVLSFSWHFSGPRVAVCEVFLRGAPSGRKTRIAVSRFRPTTTGYELVSRA